MLIELGAWEPDAPKLGSDRLIVARNVLPTTKGAYSSMPGIEPVSAALPAACVGALAAEGNDGTVYVFAGTAAAIHRLGGADWADVSQAGGYTGTAGDRWRGVEIGNRVVMTNFQNPIQSFVLGSSSLFDDLAATAPRAYHIAQWHPGFLVVGNTYDDTDGGVPYRIWWSGVADPTAWPTPGSADAAAVQSDYTDLFKGGSVMALTGPVGGASGSVFCERAVWRADYAGPPAVFQLTQVEEQRGTAHTNGVVNIGNVAFYLSDSGFFMFDGSTSTPIGAGKVDEYFRRDLHDGYPEGVHGFVDPTRTIVGWWYPRHGYGATPRRAVLFNWANGRWTQGDQAIEFAANLFSPGYRLEDLDAFGNMETIGISLDSPVWQGGRLQAAFFTSDHKLAFWADGSPLEATIETGELTSSDNGRLFTSGVRFLAEGGQPSVRIGSRNSLTQSNGSEATVAYSEYTAAGVDGRHPQRVDARYQRFCVKMAAGSRWLNASGVEVGTRRAGNR